MSTVTTYLEMRSPDKLRAACYADERFQIRQKERDGRFDRDLYFAVGERCPWFDKRPWTDEQWKEYGLAPELRTFGAYRGDSLAGYYNLRRDHDGNVEIAYFGLLPDFVGRGWRGRCSRVRSRKGGGCRLQSSVFGCTPPRAINRGRWPTTKPAE